MDLGPESVTIRRHIVHDDVYDLIRNLIVRGTLAPESRLRDVELAERLGVSRTPIREALLRLEAEGLVETKANRWTRVAPLNLVAAVERYPIIWRLEQLAVELAPSPLPPAALDAMAAANRRLAQALDDQDSLAAIAADDAFHRESIVHAGNSELVLVLAQLKTKLKRIEVAYFDDLFLSRQSLDEHNVILQQFTNGDPVRASEAIERNWRGSLHRMNQILNPPPPEPDNFSAPRG